MLSARSRKLVCVVVEINSLEMEPTRLRLLLPFVMLTAAGLRGYLPSHPDETGLDQRCEPGSNRIEHSMDMKPTHVARIEAEEEDAAERQTLSREPRGGVSSAICEPRTLSKRKLGTGSTERMLPDHQNRYNSYETRVMLLYGAYF
jgi:hypothetical protein